MAIFAAMNRIHQVLYSLLIIAIVSTGCNRQEGTDEIVNVYTHRHYETDAMLFKQFTMETGITVNVVKASADELIQKLEMEGKNSPADVLITVDGGRLHRATEKGLLQPIESPTLKNNIDPVFRDDENYWFGLTYRARVIAYNTQTVDPSELSTYEALTDASWQGRILVRTSENLYNQSLMAGLIVHDGETGAKEWASGVVKNMARSPKGNDTDQIKAVAAGIGDIAIVNTYYLGRLKASEDPRDQKVMENIGVFFPNQDAYGTHVNVSGGGITNSSRHRENAVKLLEFLSSKEAQKVFAEANYEYPTNPEVEWSAPLQAWGTFKYDTIDLSQLGTNNQLAVRLFDEAGWQ